MFHTAALVCLVAVVMLGCEDRTDAPATTPLTARGQRIRVHLPAPPPPPTPPSPAPAPAAAHSETTRLTSEGERIRVQILPLDPTLEVPAGSSCGVLNERGEMLSCQPGTICVSSSEVEGSPATCQPAPRAPRWDG
jgi:hypothetical protein